MRVRHDEGDENSSGTVGDDRDAGGFNVAQTVRFGRRYGNLVAAGSISVVASRML